MESLRHALPRGLVAEPEGDCYRILDARRAEVALIVPDDDEGWAVGRGMVHAHCESPEEASALLREAVRGKIAWVEHFRGDQLAATWLEDLRGQEPVRWADAIFLCPFDTEDWIAYSGERWRTRRTVLHLNLLGRVRENISVEESTAEASPEFEPLTWLEDALGNPPPGSRWTTGYGHWMAIAVPNGWRIQREPSPTGNETVFARPGSHVFIVVNPYFRDAEGSPELVQSARPTTIEGATIPASEETSGWNVQQWTLEFLGTRKELCLVVCVYSRPEDEHPASLIEFLETLLPEWRHTPTDWQMQREL